MPNYFNLFISIVVDMYSTDLIEKVKLAYGSNKSIRKVAEIFSLPVSTVQYMINNDYKRKKQGVGRPKIIKNREQNEN